MRLDHGTYTQAKTIQSQAGAQDWIEYSPGDKILPSAVAYGRKCMFRLMDDSEVELCLYSGTTLPVVTKAIRFPDDVTSGEMITVMDGAEVAQHMRPPEITSASTDITPPQLWDPSLLDISVGWYDSSDLSTISGVGSVIQQWRDKSANNNDLTAFGDPEFGSILQNNLNTIDLDGHDYFQNRNVALPASGNVQIFIVCNVTQVDNSADSIMAFSADDNDFQIGAGPGGWKGKVSARNLGSNSTKPGTNIITGMNIWNVTFNYTAGSYMLRLNGGQLGGTIVGDYNTKLATSGELRIFANRSKNQFPAGQVAEIIIIEDVSDSTRQKIEGYLAHKWGLDRYKLAADHPYKSSPPTVVQPTPIPTPTPSPTPLPVIDAAVLQEMTSTTPDNIPGFNSGSDFQLVGYLNPWVDYGSSRHTGTMIQDSVDNTRYWTLESTGVDTRMGAFEFFDDAGRSIQTDPLHDVDRSISVWFLPNYDLKMQNYNGTAAQMNLWSNHYRDDGSYRGGDECRITTEWIDAYPTYQYKASRAGVVCSSQKAFAYDHTVEKSPRYVGWNNITMTIQSASTTGNTTKICLYLNGQLLECGTTANNPTVATTSYPGKLFIGSFTRPDGGGSPRRTDPYAGLIGEVMLWQGALIAPSVNYLYTTRSAQYSSMPQSL